MPTSGFNAKICYDELSDKMLTQEASKSLLRASVSYHPLNKVISSINLILIIISGLSFCIDI